MYEPQVSFTTSVSFNTCRQSFGFGRGDHELLASAFKHDWRRVENRCTMTSSYRFPVAAPCCFQEHEPHVHSLIQALRLVASGQGRGTVDVCTASIAGRALPGVPNFLIAFRTDRGVA